MRVSPSPSFTVETEERVGAPPAEVFEYFVDPEKYRRWKGVDAELDPRPGGVYRVVMTPGVEVQGKYLEVEPPDRLLLSWGFEGRFALPAGLQQVPPGSSLVEFRFLPDGDGTIIRVRHTGLPTEEARGAHRDGWDGYLPRLRAVLAGEEPARDPSAVAREEYEARLKSSEGEHLAGG